MMGSGYNGGGDGCDSTGEWTPGQYAIDAGWDFDAIEATAQNGVADADDEILSPDQSNALLAWCKAMVRDDSK